MVSQMRHQVRRHELVKVLGRCHRAQPVPLGRKQLERVRLAAPHQRIQQRRRMRKVHVLVNQAVHNHEAVVADVGEAVGVREH